MKWPHFFNDINIQHVHLKAYGTASLQLCGLCRREQKTLCFQNTVLALEQTDDVIAIVCFAHCSHLLTLPHFIWLLPFSFFVANPCSPRSPIAAF